MSKCKVYFLKTKSRRNWELALEFREHCSICAVSESTFDFFDSKNVDFMSLENIFWTVSSFVKICHVKKVVKIGFFLYAIKYITKRCFERNSFYVSFKFCLYVQFVEMSVSKAGRKTVEFGILISFINYCVCVFFLYIKSSFILFVFQFLRFFSNLQNSKTNSVRPQISIICMPINRLEYFVVFVCLFIIKAHWLRYRIYTFCWYFQWYHKFDYLILIMKCVGCVFVSCFSFIPYLI